MEYREWGIMGGWVGYHGWVSGISWMGEWNIMGEITWTHFLRRLVKWEGLRNKRWLLVWCVLLALQICHLGSIRVQLASSPRHPLNTVNSKMYVHFMHDVCVYVCVCVFFYIMCLCASLHITCVCMTDISPQQLLSPYAVAVYGSLCALASYDRQELYTNVIASRYVELYANVIASRYVELYANVIASRYVELYANVIASRYVELYANVIASRYVELYANVIASRYVELYANVIASRYVELYANVIASRYVELYANVIASRYVELYTNVNLEKFFLLEIFAVYGSKQVYMVMQGGETFPHPLEIIIVEGV